MSNDYDELDQLDETTEDTGDDSDEFDSDFAPKKGGSDLDGDPLDDFFGDDSFASDSGEDSDY